MTKQITILCGETSGDQLAAQLIHDMQQINPQLSFSGMGGQYLKNAGATQLVDSESLAIIGVSDIVKKIFTLKKAFKTIKSHLTLTPPDLLILIDNSGFNLRIARMAKRLGIRVFYYVSPQIWASRFGRIHQLKKYADHIGVLYHFEKEIYQQANIPVTHVGHQLANLSSNQFDPNHLRNTLQLDPSSPVIALLPGSRRSELRFHLPLLKQTITQLRETQPDIQFILPLAPNLSLKDIEDKLPEGIHCIQQHTHAAIALADVALVCSGTATLEVALLNTPMVIFYKLSAFNYFIMKRFVKTNRIGLCNIVAEKDLAQEYIQTDATAEHLTQETLRLLMQNTSQPCDQHTQLRTKLTPSTPSDSPAHTALRLI